MLLPVGIEETNGRRLPVATLVLMLVNTGVYLLCAFAGIPYSTPGWHAFLAPPAVVLDRWALTPEGGSLLGILTAPWIHANILHLAGNLLFLWVFGTAAEDALGLATLLGVYLAGGFASGVVQFMAAQMDLAPGDVHYAGASGAVIAVIIVYAIRRYRARVRLWLVVTDLRLPVWGALLAFILWYGVLPALNQAIQGPSGYWGHVGGAAAGLLMALAFRLAPQGAAEYSLEDALARIERGSLREGLHELEQLQRLTPQDTRVVLALARTYLRIWDRPAAADYYMQAVRKELAAQRVGEAIRIWEEALASGAAPDAPQALPLAGAAVRAGLKSQAASLYRWIEANTTDSAAASVARQQINLLRPGDSPD